MKVVSNLEMIIAQKHGKIPSHIYVKLFYGSLVTDMYQIYDMVFSGEYAKKVVLHVYC